MATLAEAAAIAGNALNYSEGRMFAAIVGESPSRGARSPALWDSAFAAHGVDARMLPLDVGASAVRWLLDALDANPFFLGGAIAAPYKETVARWLGARVAPDARPIGAVNCLFRGADGKLSGTNTDGLAAVESFAGSFGYPRGKKVVLLGGGGAGKAVAAFFRRAVGDDGRLVILSRSASGESLAAALEAEWAAWADIDREIRDAEVLVNCTSVGAQAQSGASPLSAAQLRLMPDRAAVFDINYEPSPTVLLSLAGACGLACFDGAAMNLEQAVLAYGYAAPQPKGAAATRSAMVAARRQLG